jgi:hypothetical protein
MATVSPALESERKIARLSTLCSTVDFSDGTTTFSLPLLQALVVERVIEHGPTPPSDLVLELRLKAEEVEPAVGELARRKIVRVADGRVCFVGPPQEQFEEGLPGEPQRMPEDPALFTNIGQAIESAIMLYLKNRRFAPFDEIKAGVYEIVPRHFPVTDEKIRIAIERLVANFYICQHPGGAERYRYIKT